MAIAALPECGRPAARGITATHEFAAPAWLVYEAFSRPELVRRWWGTSGLLTRCRGEVRPGGAFVYESCTAAGPQRQSGSYTVVEPEQRLVFSLDSEDGSLRSSAIVTVSFLEQDGRTHLTATFRHASAEEFAAALEAGFERIAADRFARLAALLSALL